MHGIVDICQRMRDQSLMDFVEFHNTIGYVRFPIVVRVDFTLLVA